MRLGISHTFIFQSTLPHGERPLHTVSVIYADRISIHAPAWGATSKSLICGQKRKFQSTLPHGERHAIVIKNNAYRIFQSTLPHGERRRDVTVKAHVLFWISIHAPAWGATDKLVRDKMLELFQSTLPHGERLWSFASIAAVPRIFQSTLPHGERLPTPVRQRTQKKFQSTLPHGERRYTNISHLFHRISIHAPAWGATGICIRCSDVLS